VIMKMLKFLAISLLVVNTGVRADSIKAGKPVDIVVYRSPTCGCCGKWVEHLKENNFKVKDIVTNEVDAIKTKYGVSKTMASCHTAKVGDYIIEGHVPAKDIVALLKTKPDVVGLAVPGMPAGTPGMEMGGKKDAYNVMSFDKENHYQIFNSYKGN
ncbi:MAG: DUF411 domain-containing protein, partial [Methylobacter sp.]